MFLSRHAQRVSPSSYYSLFPCLTTWQILLRFGKNGGGRAVLSLYVVEEDVTRSSRSVYCDQCRVVGWSRHPVCKKRYHFIIREESCEQLQGGERHDKACGNMVHFSDSRCKSVITEDNLQDWLYPQFEDSTHLLHGVVHSNGYGHLLTLNGREGGSRILSGRDIMSLWDRLCETLAVRKISVMDASKKYGMEYRLLHAISDGHSWYGNWGYEFGAGSYALTQDAYHKAVTTLSNIPLSLFSYQGRRPRTHLQDVITFYQSISDTELVMLRDLISFLLRQIHETHRSPKIGTTEKSMSSTTNVLCVWTKDDVERVEQSMIKLLLTAANWVSRRALKGALCKAASPELLDYCLKQLKGNTTANGMVVTNRYNPTSAEVEFRLEQESFLENLTSSNQDQPSKEHLICDLKFLYDSLIHPQKMVGYKAQTRELVIDSATKILDCKQFVKDYKPDKMVATNPLAIYLWCHVELKDQSKDDPAPPPELIILPEKASVADLKLEATKAFQEVYTMFKRFEVDKMLDYGPLDDSMTLKLLVGHIGSVRVQGRCLKVYGLGHFRMERGTENWTVDCICGAKDDDGERMLACDECGIWQHTRCAGIDNQEAAPAKFVCMRCLNSHQKRFNDVQSSKGSNKVVSYFRAGKICRHKAVTTSGLGVGSSSTMSFGVR